MEGWRKVPDVLLLHIYSYLPFRDKLSASSTCRHWRELFFHPINWSHICFSYLKQDKGRENFLNSKTSHFLSGCTIYVPVEQELFESHDNYNNFSHQRKLDLDLESLMCRLSHNKNISQLAIVQSCAKPIPFPFDHSDSFSTETKSYNQHSASKTHSDCENSKADAFLTNKVGVVTRSKSTIEKSEHGYELGCECTDPGLLVNHSDNLELNASSKYTGEFNLYYTNRSASHRKSFTSNKPSLSIPRKNGSTARLQYIDYIKQIIASASSLRHLSLGCLPSVTQHNHEVIESLKQCQSCSIQSLHINRCQQLEQCVYQPIELQDLLQLRNLQHLSLDSADISDLLLAGLTEGGRSKLSSLNITIFSHVEGIRQIRDRTWNLVHQSYPDLELTLNIVKCPAAVRDMMTVINPSMPLTHLRVLLCDEFYVSGLHHVARHQAPTLKSLQIIESMREGPMFYDIGVDEQDPFVMMAWRCKKLSSFSVIGVALREHDVLAVARLRGMQLTKFEVLEECITAFNNNDSEFEEDYAMSFETFCEEISASMGMEWMPLAVDDAEVDPSLVYYESPECNAYLPILMGDHQSNLPSSNKC